MTVTAEVSIVPEIKVQVLVIGTGFGGSVAACRLSQAGFGVLVVERGRRYEAQDFPALPEEQALLPDLRRWAWSVSQGLWDVIDLGELVSAQAAGYGGGSLIYANVHLRPPAKVFDERWPAVYRHGGDLEPFFDLAASMLNVSPVTESATLDGQMPKAKQLEYAMARLNRTEAFFHPPLAVTYEAGTNAQGRAQKACTGCGACCSGCPETAKNTLDFNYLALAESSGAQVKTQCEVLGFESIEAGRYRYRVKCLDHLEARTFFIHCEYLVLSAGVVHTTRLLAGAKLSGAEQLKQLVGVGYFPGGDALGMVYDTAQPQEPSKGPTITTSTVHWRAPHGGSFFLLQDGGYAEQLARVTGLLRAPAWLGRNRFSHRDRERVPQSQPEGSADTPSRALPSIVDDLLSALAAGNFDYLIKPGVASAFTALLQELKDPLLLPSIVERTIAGGILERNARWFGKFVQPLAGVLDKVAIAEKFIISKAYGNDDGLAVRALRAAFAAGGLSARAVAAKTINYDARGASHRAMLLAMGRDAAAGHLRFDPKTERLSAELDLFSLTPGYVNQEQLMTDVAKKLGGELRTNPGWAVSGKPVTVHNQGGCPMSDRVDQGVTTADGQVHGQEGLYVMDAAVFCSSVGVNPSATILAISERNVLRMIKRHHANDDWENSELPGAKQYRAQRRAAHAWRERAEKVTPDKKKWALSPPDVASPPFESKALGIEFHEEMTGYFSEATGSLARNDARYRALEIAGRPDHYMKVRLHVWQPELTTFFQDPNHTLLAEGSVYAQLPGDSEAKPHEVRGWLELFAPAIKAAAIPVETLRHAAQMRLAPSYSSTNTEREERFLNYTLDFVKRPGWKLEGYKRIRDQPGLGAWRDVSCLFVELSGPPQNSANEQQPANNNSKSVVRFAGVVRIDLFQFLSEQVASVRALGTKDSAGKEDPIRATWAATTFAKFFFVSLQRIYLPELNTLLASLTRRAS